MLVEFPRKIGEEDSRRLEKRGFPRGGYSLEEATAGEMAFPDFLEVFEDERD